MSAKLSESDRTYLLRLARESIASRLDGHTLPEPKMDQLSPELIAIGASFVTLTIHGSLRGCIGSLEAHQPLVLDVREHAIEAAFEDYRFRPLTHDELKIVKIEISRLTAPVPLFYSNPADLPGRLRPGIDGVILKDGYRRATFLPQVWEQLSDVQEFLSHLCAKMGAAADLWRKKVLEVSTYQVEEFHE